MTGIEAKIEPPRTFKYCRWFAATVWVSLYLQLLYVPMLNEFICKRNASYTCPRP